MLPQTPLRQTGDVEVAQWVRTLANKAEDLSPVHGPRMVGGERRLSEMSSGDHTCHGVCKHMYTIKITDFF